MTVLEEPTAAIRWVLREKIDLDCANPFIVSVLQQKWKLVSSERISFEWRDVPIEPE